MSDLWQVYLKIDGQWRTHGAPTTKEHAENIVAELWVPLQPQRKKSQKPPRVDYREPHCVPV